MPTDMNSCIPATPNDLVPQIRMAPELRIRVINQTGQIITTRLRSPNHNWSLTHADASVIEQHRPGLGVRICGWG